MRPAVDPHTSGLLDRPGGVRLFWEESGAPDGVPALYLHGGPGGGLGRGGYRRVFDPQRYRIVGMDQRGCGRSTPLACDDLDALDTNTTQALVADIEALREHLGVDRWVLYGVSWGSTLALAYALVHPERVAFIALMAVTTTSRFEVDWITSDVGAIFPEAWERFAAHADARPGERVVEAYARLLRDPDLAVRQAAADAWDAWEASHIGLTPGWIPGAVHEDPHGRRLFATLVTHYWANDGFLRGDDRILAHAGDLTGVPGVLVHGRRDVSGPAVTAWRLHEAWPTSDLHIVEDEGHGGPASGAIIASALDTFVAGR